MKSGLHAELASRGLGHYLRSTLEVIAIAVLAGGAAYAVGAFTASLTR